MDVTDNLTTVANYRNGELVRCTCLPHGASTCLLDKRDRRRDRNHRTFGFDSRTDWGWVQDWVYVRITASLCSKKCAVSEAWNLSQVMPA